MTAPELPMARTGCGAAPGTLEAEVLAILRAAGGPLSPGEVRERLARGPAGASCPTARW